MASVIVTVTTFGPISEHTKCDLSIVEVEMLQLSEAVSIISFTVISTKPWAFNSTVMSFVVNTGSTLSTTVTFAIEVPEFPDRSVTLSITKFSPIFEQSKVFGITSILSILQLSTDPLFISLGLIVALPVLSRYTMISCDTAVGGVVSTTFTIAVAEEVFPDGSVAVNVTVLGLVAISEHEKFVLSKTKVETSTLSVVPLSTMLGVIIACPESSKTATMFFVTTTGASVSGIGSASNILTIAVEYWEFPDESVTVNTTILSPKLVSSKSVLLTAKLKELQLS